MGSWKMDKLGKMVPMDAIPILPALHSDIQGRIIWGKSYSREFNVKSAYCFLDNDDGRGQQWN